MLACQIGKHLLACSVSVCLSERSLRASTKTKRTPAYAAEARSLEAKIFGYGAKYLILAISVVQPYTEIDGEWQRMYETERTL